MGQESSNLITTVTDYPQSIVKETKERLSFTTKLSYGLGDFACQLFWSFSGSYLTIFYTDVVGFTPAIAAMIILIARITDSFADPVIGFMADRTKSKFGRFRPYILYGTPVLALFSVLAFTSPEFGGNMQAKVAWAFITYIVLGFIYAVVNLPYGSLAAVMSKDPGERTALSSFRMLFTNLGGVLFSTISMPLILFFSQGAGDKITARGYSMTAVVLALIAIPMLYLVFYNSREVVQPISKSKITFKETMKAIFTSKSIICLFLILLLSLTAFFGRLGVQIYYYIYVIQRMDLIPYFMPLPAIGAAIGIMSFTRFAKKFGKKKMLYLSYLLGALSLIFLYFVDSGNLPLLLLGTFIFGLTQFGVPIVLAMIPDAIDEIEDKKQIRVDGTAYSTTSLSTKFASGLGGGAVALLGLFGYVANSEQTAEAMNGINLIVNIGPAIMFLLAIIPTALYGLSEDKAEEIRQRLDERRRIE
jgi:sugar (glycoside-pentoside-hexuronide) transporter